VYGGQVIGNEESGSFYLNGPYSPMGRKADSRICWDESRRERYGATDVPGIFEVPGVGERCQPYLLIFGDKIGLKGHAISSDQLYYELGTYRYPLPSNSISGMSFCTLTPRETDLAISLLREEPVERFSRRSSEEISMEGSPVAFDQGHGIFSLQTALRKSLLVSEAHMEASVIANPCLLPKEMRPKGATICRQVPISPFKPAQMDRADICYYSEDNIADGTIPNTIIELKMKRAGKWEIRQIKGYLRWLHKVLGREARRISMYLLAPSFADTKEEIPQEYSHQVKLIGLEE
ncbi:MAG: hypothetical protein KAW09_03780, partial [Thermoplasmata archaeon]|nr:hypothetical protein [Thermoplasmata archaeon]